MSPTRTVLLGRRDANTAAPSSITRALAELASSSSSIVGTSTITSPTAGTTSNNFNNSAAQTGYDENTAAFTTSWITYLAIIVVAGVLVALLSSRYFYIRRFYASPSFRAYFLPRNGIHIPFLRLHIAGPPARINVDELRSRGELDEYGASANQRRERRRRRRNRQTVGETLGEGGTRLGERDQDDQWDDDDDLELGGQGGGGGGQEMRERMREDLPQYHIDSGLPAYAPPPPPVGFFEPASSTSTSTSDTTPNLTTETDEVDALPTAAEYEALSRVGRDAPGGGSLSIPTYPPPIHVHNPHLYPSEPPPSFSRANSGISTRSRRSTRRNPNTGPFTANRGGVGGQEENEVERREREEQEEMDREERETATTRRRESSLMTSNSSASKLGDEDLLDDETDSFKSRRTSTGTTSGLVASGSRLTLDETKEKVKDENQH